MCPLPCPSSDDFPPRRSANRSYFCLCWQHGVSGNSFMSPWKINKALPSPVKVYVQSLCKKYSDTWRLKNNTASWNKSSILNSDRVQPFSNFPFFFTPKCKQWFQKAPFTSIYTRVWSARQLFPKCKREKSCCSKITFYLDCSVLDLLT